MISGIGAILMADSRATAKLGERVSPLELIESVNRVTTVLISAVEKNGGIVHLHVGGSLIAFWPPSMMPAAARTAISAAAEAVAACGESIAVSVAVADLAFSEVAGAARRPILVGAAYQRAEATIRAATAGRVAVDSDTLRSLPADISSRFVANDGHAELR